MSRVIAIANQKGGVAKTTTTINAAHALAELGNRVLMVDFDPQSSLTVALQFDMRQLGHSVYNALIEDQHIKLVDVIRPTNMEGVDIAPASIELSKAERQLINEINREHALAHALAPVRDRYDYILIDCPPSLGILTTNALAAADEVLIPIESDYLALKGAQLLLDTIETVKRKLQHHKLAIIGVLVTKYDARTAHSKEMLREIGEAFGDLVLDTPVRLAVVAKDATAAGQSIIAFNPNSPLAASYRALANQIVLYGKAA